MADPTLLPPNDFAPSVQVYIQWLSRAVAMRQSHAKEQGVEIEVPLDLDRIQDLPRLWEMQRNLVGGAIEAVPADEPTQVASIAHAILKPYRVRDGKVQLAGCVLEAQPFLRITTYQADNDKLSHHWFDRDGSLLLDELPKRFDIQELVAVESRLRETDGPTVNTWIDAVTRDMDREQLVGATVVWFRQVIGKIRFQFESGVYASLPFNGWAIDWAAGWFDSPRFVCPESGIESYNIVCLDDGTVTVAEAVGVCDATGKETLKGELQNCTVSEKSVRSDQLISCPVSGDRLLPNLGDSCAWCRRTVSPAAMMDGRCGDCRKLAPIGVENPVVKSVREQRTGCAKMKHWKGWISDDLAVLVGSNWLREMMVVVSLADMRIIRTAARRRLSTSWQFDDQES